MDHPSDHPRLVAAVKSGNAPEVERLLNAGVDPTIALSEGHFASTALHIAACAGDVELVKILLNNGCNANIVGDSSGIAPVHCAACEFPANFLSPNPDYGHADVLASLLERGGNPRQRDILWTQPLHQAAGSGHTECCQLLLRNGAPPDARTNSGEAPLHNAAVNGHEEIVRLLLDSGGEGPSITDDNGHTPLHWAASNGHAGVCRLLLERDANPNDKDHTAGGTTPMFMGAAHPKVVALLLVSGSDVNARNGDGATPLMRSAFHGSTESVTLLLDHGANPWLADNEGETALSMCEEGEDATWGGDRAGTRAALEHAMNITWQNNSPPTLEELAAFQLRRMRSQIDEEEFVDTIPDALVWMYFREWKGADKWTGLWRGDELGGEEAVMALQTEFERAEFSVGKDPHRERKGRRRRR